jgi:hypothetical protein
MAKIYSTEEVIKKFKEVHEDRYDYSKYVYPGRKELKGIVVCKDHGEFNTTRMHHEKGVGCPVCAGVPRGGFKRKGQDSFLEEMNMKFDGSLDFSNFVYKNNITKGIVICPIHGEFEKTPKLLIRGQGCPICSGKVKLTLKKVQEKLDEIHGENHYIVDPTQEYVNNKTDIKLWCSIHEKSWEARPDNLIGSQTRCPICADIQSKIEEELRNYIETLESNIIPNTRKIIHPLELDVYIPDRNLAIEMNGLHFHGDRSGKNKDYHLFKTEECLKLNIRLLHIFEDEWRDKKDIWKSIIQHRLNKTPHKYYARKCDIREVTISEASQFLHTNHLQGYSKSSIRLGLYYNNELVCILTMGKSRFDNNIEWEICRFANKLNSNVVGGFQRLMKHFIKKYSPKSIVTYADRRYSEGDLYRKFGMIEQENKSLNYFYFNRHEMIRHSRHKFQKHKLKNILPFYTEELSESDNAKMNGFDRIWDCGNKKFVWIS